MPSPLRIFAKDPNKKGRGKGVYYLRGHGKFSKYSRKRDEKKKSTGWKIHVRGLPKGSKLLHTSDGRLKR